MGGPYDLAVHKNKPAVAAVLKSQMMTLHTMLNPSIWESQIRQFVSIDTMKQLCLLRTWKTWLGLPELDDLDESPRFPFYCVIGHMVCHVGFTFAIFIPIFDVSKGVLWDYIYLFQCYNTKKTKPTRFPFPNEQMQVNVSFLLRFDMFPFRLGVRSAPRLM
jgi:hypothetical protein